MTLQDEAPQRRTLKQLTAKLKEHSEQIAKHRDALRELKNEIDCILGPTEEGVQLLDDAIDTFSEQL